MMLSLLLFNCGDYTRLTDTVYPLKDRMVFDVSDWYWKDGSDVYSRALSRSIQNENVVIPLAQPVKVPDYVT